MFSILLCSFFFLTSSHLAKLFLFNWKIISSVTVTWDATSSHTMRHIEIFLAVKKWTGLLGLWMVKVHRSQHAWALQNSDIPLSNFQMCRRIPHWQHKQPNSQKCLGHTSWSPEGFLEIKAFKEACPWGNVLDSANYMSSSFLALFSNLPGCC